MKNLDQNQGENQIENEGKLNFLIFSINVNKKQNLSLSNFN